MTTEVRSTTKYYKFLLCTFSTYAMHGADVDMAAYCWFQLLDAGIINRKK